MKGVLVSTSRRLATVLVVLGGMIGSAPGQTFTKIATGPLVTDTGTRLTTVWADFDHDGNVDAFAANALGGNNFLYRNLGDGTFESLANNPITLSGGDSTAAAWGDYDNDGNFDLFVVNRWQNHFLYRGLGGTSFEAVASSAVLDGGPEAYHCAWVDYDNDGLLDMFVVNAFNLSFLYHNDGGGNFTKNTGATIANGSDRWIGSAWGDYNNDGRMDVFMAGFNFTADALYRNDGQGIFTSSGSGDMVSDTGGATSASWADYDNDGDLDLFVANRDGVNFLYRNEAGTSFTTISSGEIVTDVADSNAGVWGDYDNDGWLDLYVANGDTPSNQGNFLYHNNGDGTFAKVATGAPVTDTEFSASPVWVDYDNDGDLDLFVASVSGTNSLYNNGGNANHWLKVRLVGTQSNRSAIGARIKVTAQINGGSLSQMREVSGDGGFTSQNLESSHFGLGDANVANTVRVEWPSGRISSLQDVSTDQTITILEDSGMNYVVVPGEASSTEQPGYSASLSQASRFQQVYPADQFPSTPVRIIALRFRRDSSQPAFASGSATIRFKLCTTSRSESDLSFNFADNIGADQVTVFDGLLTVSSPSTGSGAPYPFEIVVPLSTPFEYDPKGGNLLIEHQVLSGSTIPYTDGPGVNGDGVARAFALNADAAVASVVDTGGDVIQFDYTPLGGSTFNLVTNDAIATDANDSIGATWGDVNGDGWEDLYVANYQQANALYLNNGDGTFSSVSGVAPVQPVDDSLAASLADVDNDGDLDLFVSNVGNDRLYINNGDGTWTEQSGDPTELDGLVSMGAGWADFDGDGLVDLAVAAGGGVASQPNLLYRNLGNGSFERLTTGSVAGSAGFNISASWADYNSDGRPDLLLTGNNLLFQNDGGGDFTEITSTPISVVSGFPSGGAWADFDNDGDLDLLVVNITGDPVLYRNGGDGNFSDISIPAFGGVRAVALAWGDFDKDGYIDVAMAQRGGPLLVFKNYGNGQFGAGQQPNPSAVALGNAVSWVDYDHDGDLDLFVARGGDTGAVNNQTNLLLKNAGNPNGWLVVKLNGSVSNRGGVGAKIHVSAVIGGNPRQQLRQVGGGDSYGGNLDVAHFGLGDASTIDQIQVEWPSGVVQTLQNVAINQRLTINEEDAPASVGFQPAGGLFTNSVQVTLSSGIFSGVIRYTTDGSDPSVSSTAYDEPFTLSQTTTVNARLFVNGFPASDTYSATYTLYVPPDIQFLPSGQLFTNLISVSLVNNVGAGVIRYTLDGSAPSSTSTSYAGQIDLAVGTTIRAQLFLNGFVISDEFSESYARVYAFGDDGIPFAWREEHFGPDFLTDPRAAANADPDNDGYTNTEEYENGTIPVDANSAPQIILSVRAVPRLTFTTLAGRSYRIDRTTSLNPPDWQTIVESVTADGPELHYVDEEAPDNSYYRIELIAP